MNAVEVVDYLEAYCAFQMEDEANVLKTTAKLIRHVRNSRNTQNEGHIACINLAHYEQTKKEVEHSITLLNKILEDLKLFANTEYTLEISSKHFIGQENIMEMLSLFLPLTYGMWKQVDEKHQYMTVTVPIGKITLRLPVGIKNTLNYDKKIEKLKQELEAKQKLLSNEKFVSKAPKDIISETKRALERILYDLDFYQSV